MSNAANTAADVLMQGLRDDFGQTPSQTVGPYFAYGLTSVQYGYDYAQLFDGVLALDAARGERMSLEGRVFDGNGVAVFDALIEISQVDGDGHYPASEADAERVGFRAFGRGGTGVDAASRYRFETVKPGVAQAGSAPHVNVIVTMRGLLLNLFTRVYFADEPQANAVDPVLGSVPAQRRRTLLAHRIERAGQTVYQFDIHMQGEHETVFFDL
ncbi:protocatechuate 3,4-dioxygenase subunit alpha [soil metagenome]